MSRKRTMSILIALVVYLIFGYIKDTHIIDLVGFKQGVVYHEKVAKADFNEERYNKLSLKERMFNHPYVLSVVSFFMLNILFVYLFALIVGLNKKVLVSITFFILTFFGIAVLFNLLSLWNANPLQGLFYRAFKGIGSLLFSIRLGLLALIVLVIIKVFKGAHSSGLENDAN